MKVTQDMIIQINELYKELKTYAAVSRVVGVSPTTVKKYVVQDYQKPTSSSKENIIQEQEINFEIFNRNNWNILLELMPREIDGINELRKEVIF